MSKSKRSAKSNKANKPNSKPKVAKKSRKQRELVPAAPADPVEQPAVEVQPQSDCPYRPGTLYGTLFIEGNRDYIPKGELIKKVAELTGKSEKVVGFAYQVLKSKTHRSNKNRSTELTEGDKVKLVAIQH